MITRGPMSAEDAEGYARRLCARGYTVHEPLKAARPGEFAIHSDEGKYSVLVNPTPQDAMLAGEWHPVAPLALPAMI